MYINPFVAGVVSTLVVGLVAIIAIALYSSNKNN